MSASYVSVESPDADDDDTTRRLVSDALQENGCVVLQAKSGIDALNVANRSQDMIDLLLTDVVVPGLSGPELAKQLKAARAELRVLYTTGYWDTIPPGSLDLASSAELLLKPFLVSELISHVAQLLGARQE